MALLLAGMAPFLAAAQRSDMRLEDMGLTALEHELAGIDSELGQLARLTLRRGVGSLGYRSNIHGSPGEKEWVRIELGEETPIDGVTLVPMLFRETQTGVQAEGFPKAFRILAGTGQTTNEVAVVSEKDHIMPRIAPLALTFPPTKASWVMIETTALTTRMMADHYFLQLSEIMVFSGQENVALHKPVTLPPNSPEPHTSLNGRFIVDGFTPYVLDAAYGDRSKSLPLTVSGTNPPPRISIDLGTPHPINQVNLHSAGLSHAIPMGNFATWGVPRHVRVVGANEPDFSDARILCEYRQESIYDNGPAIMRRFPQTTCRYIGVEILDRNPVVPSPSVAPYIAFSEIEVLSSGKNAALHAPVSVCTNIISADVALPRITDGLNYYGKILPLREWMAQLSRRHDLEAVRPFLEAELNHRYERQKINLRRLGWLAALLAVGIAIAILVERLVHMRQIARIQERFAADLHDELGADLHTIGLLSDLAGDAGNESPELSHLLKEIRTTTEETGEAVRLVARMNSKLPYLNLVEMMQQAAERVVVHLEHDVSIEGAQHLKKLKPRTRSDIFLFYKEALINICRHAEATKLSTHLRATPKEIRLTVADNGHGLPDFGSDTVPKSLRRRARLMGAKVEVENILSGGTSIVLNLRLRRFKIK